MTTVTLTGTVTGTWTVPADCPTVVDLVEVWGAGAGGSSYNSTTNKGGGGGGAYAAITSCTVGAAGSLIPYLPGKNGTKETSGAAATAGGNAWFLATTKVLAAGGRVSVVNVGGLGGTTVSCTGSVIRAGGNGGGGTGTTSGAGGGGAGGVDGAGNAGGAGTAAPSNGAAGGSGDAGSGGAGGAGGTSVSKDGGQGTDHVKGGGGGGGGYADAGNGGQGGAPGGGGGAGDTNDGTKEGGDGAKGKIQITYTPTSAQISLGATGLAAGAGYRGAPIVIPFGFVQWSRSL